MLWNEKHAREIVKKALKEDLGWAGDITSQNLLSPDSQSEGVILARQEGILAGLRIAKLVFTECNSQIEFVELISDGEPLAPGKKIMKLNGPAIDILKGERLALNFLQRLSGIATRTREYTSQVSDYPVRITDTRKTTPNLRMLEKYAVKIGGGHNHRSGLFDAVLIKDNHIQAVGGIKQAINKVREQISHTVKIEVEVEDMTGVKAALEAKADIIMLDNMDTGALKKAVEFIDGRAIVEASGGITLENLESVAATGVDVISVGALTHQINSLDISLSFR
ncbi:MAG: carboxylating nicotinate-nucleotide diphosphorylase [Halanaerobiaceae bacterium]